MTDLRLKWAGLAQFAAPHRVGFRVEALDDNAREKCRQIATERIRKLEHP
jgi:hypothetical protein